MRIRRNPHNDDTRKQSRVRAVNSFTYIHTYIHTHIHTSTPTSRRRNRDLDLLFMRALPICQDCTRLLALAPVLFTRELIFLSLSPSLGSLGGSSFIIEARMHIRWRGRLGFLETTVKNGMGNRISAVCVGYGYGWVCACTRNRSIMRCCARVYAQPGLLTFGSKT